MAKRIISSIRWAGVAVMGERTEVRQASMVKGYSGASFAQVFGPTTPSAARPLRRWKEMTADRVAESKVWRGPVRWMPSFFWMMRTRVPFHPDFSTLPPVTGAIEVTGERYGLDFFLTRPFWLIRYRNAATASRLMFA